MKNLAPYQIFFPIGVLSAILAVGVWFVQNLGWFHVPAILIHSKLIMGGFLWSFIVGFLMTAVPKMTGTSSANMLEVGCVAASIIMLIVFSWHIDGRYFYATHMGLIAFLVVFGVRRVLKMTKALPVFFSHVGMGMTLAFLGALFYFQGNTFLGFHLYHVGAILLLVLGIGTRFFSFLSGLPSVFESDGSRGWRAFFHFLCALTAVLFFLAGSGVKIAYLGLAIVSLVYMFVIWKVHRSSERPSALKYAVRVVAAMIPLSFFMTWMQPQLYVTWFHLLFIGCFGLLTFSVATRVTLAHGSYPIEIETKSPALWCMLIFLAMGIASRILYGYSTGLTKTSFLHFAATFWILAVGSWMWSFFSKIFVPGNQEKPSC